MSRSTKAPIYKDAATKFMKRKASRKVRALKDGETPAHGKQYRKEFNSYNLSDYSFYSPKDPKSRRK